MSHDENLMDKLKAKAENASAKLHDANEATHEKLDDAKAKLKADVQKHADR